MNEQNFPHIPRPEHPRPDFVRDTFYNLNGDWAFAFDDEDIGLTEGWYKPGYPLDKTITVPFCYQCAASGIGPIDEIHPIMWYRRSFTVPAEMQGRRILLKFGAVDHEAAVYINGHAVGGHKGGYTPFEMDITPFLKAGENDLCLRVVDEPDPIQPRGKQYWQQGLYACLYTASSGIWQTVYLEAVSDLRIDYVHVTPDIDRGVASVEIVLNRVPRREVELLLNVTRNGKRIRKAVASTENRNVTVVIDVDARDTFHPVALWSPSFPNLYDLRVQLIDGEAKLDQVDTYFGMRKVEVRNGVVYLNNKRIYQRLILDQGYWPDTMITPPSDEAIREDLEWTRKFGFTGARKHQKIEDPRYYYWADRMGILIWGELPSAFTFTDETVENLSRTMQEFIRRDFNHPSIIAWVPLNESWGVPQIVSNARQQHAASMLYYLTKAADGTRICSGNDGWEQAHTDICGLHDYTSNQEMLKVHFADQDYIDEQTCDTRRTYVDGYRQTGNEAFMVTEYGGIAFANIGLQGELGGMQTWGYHEKEQDEEAFFRRYEACTEVVLGIPFCQGYCYTQLTDVMQEINGLLTPDRKPKMDVERVRKINRKPF